MMYCGIFCPSCCYRFVICVQIHGLNQNIASMEKKGGKGETRWSKAKEQKESQNKGKQGITKEKQVETRWKQAKHGKESQNEAK